MSDNVMSTGFFAILSNPIEDEEEREELGERLYDEGSLHLNYEGTLVFSDERSDGYGINFAGNGNVRGFIDEVETAGLEIVKGSVLAYSCYWYNGTDSDMSELTLERYRKELGWF